MGPWDLRLCRLMVGINPLTSLLEELPARKAMSQSPVLRMRRGRWKTGIRKRVLLPMAATCCHNSVQC